MSGAKFEEAFIKTVKTTLNMLYLKVSSASKWTKRSFEPLLVAYFDKRKFIQGKLDRLGNHSSAGYAAVVILNIAAIILKSAVVVECVYQFRPYYWMIMKFFIYRLYDIWRKTTMIFTVTAAIMKFIVLSIFQLTSKILVPNVLLALNGVFHVTKILITPVTSPSVVFRKDWKFILQFCFLCCVVTLMLLWRRRVVSPGVTSSSEETAVFRDSPHGSGIWSMLYRWLFKDSSSDFERIVLDHGSREFQDASRRFHVTIPEYKATILVVEKIKNDFLLERYYRKREQMKKKLKAFSHDAIEKLLFHGTTSDVIDAICKQNFDHRMRGKNGTRYGEGSYFAVNASYSNSYSSQSGEKTRFMFLATVLTGEYKLGNKDLRRPPLKDPSNKASDLYDSCVDNEQEPKIFVIFNDEQCYPLYLIKYRSR